MSYTVEHFIDGVRTGCQDNEQLPIYNPALGEKQGDVLIAQKQTVRQAIESATTAFHTWSELSPQKRAAILFKYRDLLISHTDELAELVTSEHGKTIPDAKGSVARGIEVIEHMCGIATHTKGQFSEQVGTGIDCYTIRQPLGVCVGVSPFNFPVMVPVWMFASAIACGNTFVLKPSEQDPSTPVRLAELMTQAGLPKGVLNVVNGNKETVEHLITQPEVKAVTAVASTQVAESIYNTATKLGKRAHTFGGAKNHAIVMPDADMQYAADNIASAAFGSAGQRCMALSVAVCVGDDTANTLVEKIQENMQSIKVGPGDKEGMDLGPLINAQHFEKVKSYIDTGVKEGATLLVDGREFKHEGSSQGYFLGPTLFDNVNHEMRIYQEEIFGPVLALVRVPTLEAAMDLASEHEYGNGTAIFTQNGRWAQQFARNVQVGMVGINVPIPVPVAYHSFGGWKRSAFGDLAMHATESVQFYTKAKSVTVRWPEQSGGLDYSMPVTG